MNYSLSDLPPRIQARTEISETGCWLSTYCRYAWNKAYDYRGIRWRGRTRMAHRVVYEMLVGPIPEGLQLDHLCRVHRCTNPAHLEPVTHRENTLRGVGACAQHARQTQCKWGHALVQRGKGPARKCPTCEYEASKKKYARKRLDPDYMASERERATRYRATPAGQAAMRRGIEKRRALAAAAKNAGER